MDRDWGGQFGAGAVHQPERDPVRVAVIAPGLAVRTGLRALLTLDPAIEVLGEAAYLPELEVLPAGLDVLVIAGRADSITGWAAHLPADPLPAILLLLEDESGSGLVGLPQTGQPMGLLSLDASAEELSAAVHALAQGLSVGTPALFRAFSGEEPTAPRSPAEPLVESLTERETEVLQQLAQGLANKQIAAALRISEHTVKFHISAIFAKLGATSRTEAVRLGVRQGLIVL